MKKIIAQQIAPECQESPLYTWDEFPDNIAVFGNRDFNTHIPEKVREAYNLLNNCYDELLEAVDYLESDGYYDSLVDAVEAYLFPVSPKEHYTEADAKSIVDILRGYDDCDRSMEVALAQLMTVASGQCWQCATISGCMQRDWQYVVYCADELDYQDLKAFEIEYFNTGSEWLVEDDDPVCPMSFYSHEDTYEDIRREIADAFGVDAKRIVLRVFTGYKQIAQYAEV